MIKPSIFWLVICFFAAAVLAAVFGWARVGLGDENSWALWGQFGDKFGALNTLFTGLAFVGVVAALWHERDGAADRVNEHRELVEMMRVQSEASILQTNITALVSMIQYQQAHLIFIRGMGADNDGLRFVEKKIEELQADLAKAYAITVRK